MYMHEQARASSSAIKVKESKVVSKDISNRSSSCVTVTEQRRSRHALWLEETVRALPLLLQSDFQGRPSALPEPHEVGNTLLHVILRVSCLHFSQHFPIPLPQVPASPPAPSVLCLLPSPTWELGTCTFLSSLWAGIGCSLSLPCFLAFPNFPIAAGQFKRNSAGGSNRPGILTKHDLHPKTGGLESFV